LPSAYAITSHIVATASKIEVPVTPQYCVPVRCFPTTGRRRRASIRAKHL
jgi:hypothetical protein